MICGWLVLFGIFGNLTPANSGSFVGTGSRQMPPFGCHHFLSPVCRSYAVMPPNSFGLKIETPPIEFATCTRLNAPDEVPCSGAV